ALTREFGEIVAVSHLDFDLARGQCLGLLGPNGAGKTTTVRMLTALIAPTSGTASVAGHVLVEEADALRASVGLLTETPGLYERLSAVANLDLFARLYGLDPATRAHRIESILRTFVLWDRRTEPVGGFSKGMKQKVAIARALLHRPEIVFLDEPTSGLDPAAAREVAGMIRELKAEGRTIVLTTHRLAEAEELADVVAVVRGKLLAFDSFANLQQALYGRTVAVRVAGDGGAEARAKLVDAALAIAGVTGAEWREGAMHVAVTDPVAQTPPLVRALVGAGAAILSVGEVKHSLEEVYLNLTKDAAS
ncbi:MAG TPA: ABC transporter ATP-binding protein, partial [Caldimonas sp.]|nr:ABC transporter ATP-binding protein [Caldimonas sp.]